MGIKQFFNNFFPKQEVKQSSKVDRRNPTGYEVSSYGSFGYGSANKKQYLNEMKGWTYAAVSAIADEMGSINLKLYQYTKKGVEEVVDSPILDVLYRVNNFTTKFDHFWLTQSYLELTGESPWFIEKKNGIPTGIYFLRPDLITPIPDKQKVISGYKYLVDGEYVELGADEVIFLKNPNPANPFRGKGVLESAAVTVDIDNEAEQWNHTFFKNQARPDLVLKVKDVDRMSKEQREKLKESVERAHNGQNNQHKLMLLFGNMDIDTLSTSPKDMDFSRQQEMTRDKILALFRVPKAIVSQTEGVNFASAKTAQYIFARWTMKPKMERLVEQLNEFFIPMFPNSERLFLDYDNPVPEDEELLLKKYENGLTNGWLTINEVREIEGKEAIDGLDVPYLSNSVSPYNNRPNSAQSTQQAPKDNTKQFTQRLRHLKSRSGKYMELDDQINSLESSIKTAVKQKLSANKLKLVKKAMAKSEKLSGEMTDSEKKDFWAKKNLLFEEYFPKTREAQKKIFELQKKQVLAKLDKQKSIDSLSDKLYPVKVKAKDIDINKLLLNPKTQIKKELKDILPILEELFEKAANETFTLMNIDMTVDMTDSELQKKLKADATMMATEVTKTTNDGIITAVTAGIDNEEGIADIAKRVTNVFTNATENRAKMIAHTETGRYNANATELAFEKSGVVELKQWQINPDACEICTPLQGKVVKVGEPFFKKGDVTVTSDGKPYELDYTTTQNPPVHPNCRCDIVPVFKDAKSATVQPKMKKKKVNVKTITEYVILSNKEKEEELAKKMKEYEEKAAKMDTLIKELETEKDKQGKLSQEKEKELQELRDIREEMINDYNSEQENE